VPEVWYGDYLAALGAARIGERRLKALVERYGAETIGTFVREWLDYSERRMTHAIRGLPAGKLVAEGRHDSLPGLPDGVPVKVKVEVDPGEGIVTVDLRDNIDCVAVGVNLSQTCATAGALIGVLNCIDPSVPRNEGSFRRIRILLKEKLRGGYPTVSGLDIYGHLQRNQPLDQTQHSERSACWETATVSRKGQPRWAQDSVSCLD